jgi:hypothetical protein
VKILKELKEIFGMAIQAILNSMGFSQIWNFA